MKYQSGNLVGQTLGKCTLEKLIGQGGMGAVYLARQTRPARYVAVKVLQPNIAMDSQMYQAFLARFRREADVIARLEHVNIMPIYEYGEQDGLAYLVMPHLTGGSLRDVLSKRGALSLPEVVTYAQQAASALDYAHAQGVIHRDLKPANFLLHADGRLILADFGIARIIADTTTGSTLTGTGTLLGTPEYMAPEMIRGETIDYRADIYELGIVLFQMLSGRLPFTGTTPYAVAYQHVQDPLPPLHTIQPGLPRNVDIVIQKATAKQREARYSTAQALAEALSNASKGNFSTVQADPQDNIPTILSPTNPEAQAEKPVSSNRPQVQQENPSQTPVTPPPVSVTPPPTSATPPVLDYSSTTSSHTPYPVSPTPPPPPVQDLQRSSARSTATFKPSWFVFLGILLVILLIIGGVLIGLQLNKGTVVTTTSPTTASSTPAVQTTSPSTGAPTATPAATSSTGYAPTTTTSPSQATVPVGAQLYTASAPGQNCDKNGGTWEDYNNVKVTCQGSQTLLQNTAQSASLQGSFLTQIPGQTYPANYVVQVQFQQDKQSSSDFGIYFRNQPGGNQQGVYTFLVHPDGTWNVYVYDNYTGAPTKLTGGTLGDAHAQMTLAVVVNGQQFSFYANGKQLGTVNDKTYSSGTAGIALDQGGTVTASHFVLSTPSQ